MEALPKIYQVVYNILYNPSDFCFLTDKVVTIAVKEYSVTYRIF